VEETVLRRLLVRAGRDLYRQGMMAGTAGNLSARLDESRVLITPSGVAKGRLRTEDLIVISMDGKVLEGRGKPSSETGMHLAIYQRFPQVMAVIHAHPPMATALAAAHRLLAVEALAEALYLLGSVPVVPYLPPGSQQLAERVADALQQGDGALLQNHGAVTVGTTVEAARCKMEVLEALAGVTFRAVRLGGAVPLPPAEVERLRGLWQQRRWLSE